jgi:hypothetical protein
MHCETLQLTDFDLTQCEIVKETILWIDGQDHSRWVLKTRVDSRRSRRSGVYLKIWNPTYVRRDNILAGIDVGFYDQVTTPALIGPIFHKGVCSGYVANECARYWGRRWEARFYRVIQDKTARTGYFSYQFSRYHVMRFNNQPSLIDLEGIYPIGELSALETSHGEFEPRRRGLSFLTAGTKFVWNESIASFRQRRRLAPHHQNLIQR